MKNSPNLNTYSNRKRADDIGTKIISNSIMSEINAFCERDNAVRICKARQDAQTFSNDFVVGLFSGSTLISEISALNSDSVKRALRNFFLLAHDFLVRFQFIGLYYVKDINAWTEKITALAERDTPNEFDDDDDREDDEDEEYDSDSETMDIETPKKKGRKKEITVNGKSQKIYKQQTLEIFYNTIAENLPFGVIPIHFNVDDFYGQYYLVEDRRSMKRSIIFEPFDPDVSSQFEFEVIDAGVKFISTDESPFNGRTNTMNNEIIPLSPFIDLLLQSELILEAETQIFDYNSMQVYKEEYAVAVPQADAQLSGQSDVNLYSINSILGVKQMENMEREDMAMKNAAANINRLAMESSLSRSSSDFALPSIGMQRLLVHRRPQRVHFLKYLPKSVQIPNTNHPAPTHNVEQMRSKYDNDVCAIMSLPFIYYKPFGNHHNTSSSTSNNSNGGSGSGGRESNSKLEFTQKLLDEERKAQHRFFSELLRNMYGKTMGKLEAGLFRSDNGSSKQTGENNGKRGKNGLKSVSVSKFSKEIGQKIEVGIDFDKVIVKNDEAVNNLLHYYQAGLIEGYIVRKFLYQNFDITDEDPMKDPVKNPYFNTAGKDDSTSGGGGGGGGKKPKKAVKPKDKAKLGDDNKESNDKNDGDNKKKKDTNETKKKENKKEKKKEKDNDDD